MKITELSKEEAMKLRRKRHEEKKKEQRIIYILFSLFLITGFFLVFGFQREIWLLCLPYPVYKLCLLLLGLIQSEKGCWRVED